MTRVMLIGDDDVQLRSDLLAYETARDALTAYEITEPFDNTIAVETISIGAAVSLLNDLNWFLVRLVADAIVLEPSVSETEWLSRRLATMIRNEAIEPGETDEFLKIYGVIAEDEVRELVEPLFVRRIGEETPTYDLQDVSETLVVRVASDEFGS